MASRTLPGLGLTAFWDLGADGWKPGMDDNIRMLSALTQCAVKSRSTALPASPANGDIYIVRADAGAEANKIAIRDNGAWVYVTPKAGFLAYVLGDAEFVSFNGTIWAPLVAGGGGSSTIAINEQAASYTLALNDAGKLVRMNAATANSLTVPPNSSAAFAVGSQIVVRQVGAGKTTVVAGSGVTITTAETLVLRKRHSTVTLIKVGTDQWDLTGDVELAV